MIKYYKDIVFSMTEITPYKSVLIHGLQGCMFSCFKCFNQDEIILKQHDTWYDIDALSNHLLPHKDLMDVIIISGGEYLLNPIEHIVADLKSIKKRFTQKIILYTTGIDPDKLKLLLSQHLIDGIHIDMKLPYHLLETYDAPLIEMTLGVINQPLETIAKCLDSIKLVVKHDQGLSQIRSVRYPFLDQSAFDACQVFVAGLNKAYQKNTPYQVHPFIESTSY